MMAAEPLLLLVEDDEAFARTLQRSFERRGYQVALAVDPAELERLLDVRTPDFAIVDLKLGQRVQVDDGTCPAGQVKEVRGAKMTEKGVARTSACVSRFGPKSK